MKYELVIERRAEKDLLKIHKKEVERIYEAISSLESNPRPPGVKKIISEGNAWRIRVGNYRILYEIEDRIRIVTVYEVSHRKDAYKKK